MELNINILNAFIKSIKNGIITMEQIPVPYRVEVENALAIE